jgi:hypothetical protein
MTVVGFCDDMCQDEGKNGAFLSCRPLQYARHGEVFSESITVFLPN